MNCDWLQEQTLEMQEVLLLCVVALVHMDTVGQTQLGADPVKGLNVNNRIMNFILEVMGR